jgi:hypothetical protein
MFVDRQAGQAGGDGRIRDLSRQNMTQAVSEAVLLCTPAPPEF